MKADGPIKVAYPPDKVCEVKPLGKKKKGPDTTDIRCSFRGVQGDLESAPGP